MITIGLIHMPTHISGLAGFGPARAWVIDVKKKSNYRRPWA
jgi:hypothetical protein